jgi:hypothetical protein
LPVSNFTPFTAASWVRKAAKAKFGSKFYGRNLTSKAMIELLDIRFESVKDIVAINRHTCHNIMDIIIPAHGLSSEAIPGFVAVSVNLIETKQGTGAKAKPIQACITKVAVLEARNIKILLIARVFQESFRAACIPLRAQDLISLYTMRILPSAKGSDKHRQTLPQDY